MGLSVSLSNALSGMDVSQQGLDILSRNVANAGNPGYHRQSLVQSDGNTGTGSSNAHVTAIRRAFSEALQRQYSTQLGATAYSSVAADFLTRMESFLGQPGDPGSLDKIYGDFENALNALAASPDDYATRAQAVSRAQALVQQLNQLSSNVQELRREAEGQIESRVADLNRMLTSLADVNKRLIDQGQVGASRTDLMDERDRLVAGIAEIIDVQAVYRNDDSVSLMTTSGLGLVDIGASVVSFESAGSLSPSSLYSLDPSQSTVGALTITTPSGLQLDMVSQGVLQSGELAALINMRDTTLVDMQRQLDEIAAGLAQAVSSIDTAGTAVVSGAASGFEVDTADMRAGNFFTFDYSESGTEKTVKVVRVDDAGNLPMDYVDIDGQRVIGLDFSGGAAAVATALDTALGVGVAVSNPAGTVIRILDDGAVATTDISSLSMRTTVSATQGDLALSLLVDQGNSDFTNSLDGSTQLLGFSGRISVNSAILANNSLLVQYAAGGSLGDAARAEHLISQLDSMSFTGSRTVLAGAGSFRLNGTAHQFIAQMLNFQGNNITAAKDTLATRQLSLETLNQRVEAEYGVDVDEEMARLMELQNAYAASARIVSVVQELIQALMAI
jgi:flagellar hook-associated protein 1 FlgK